MQKGERARAVDGEMLPVSPRSPSAAYLTMVRRWLPWRNTNRVEKKLWLQVEKLIEQEKG